MKLNTNLKIFIAGHNGLVGSSILRYLKKKGYSSLITAERKDLDLEDISQVESFFKTNSIDLVILCAAKVGGINANQSYPFDFLYSNLQIQNNVISSSLRHNVEKLIFMGSSCIYPKNSQQPIKEEFLLSDSLEPTNRPYALAKISGIELCNSINKQFNKKYIALMPTNLYGPNDNYDLEKSHVLPALIKKIHTAKVENHKFVQIWGTGKPKREFLHSDDLASAVNFILENNFIFDDLVNKFDFPILNVGSGIDYSIKELAQIISKVVGYDVIFEFNTNMPDGTMKKLLSSDRINSYGWKHNTNLEDGISQVYEEFLNKS
jgi:GDP-L-fucose synthase